MKFCDLVQFMHHNYETKMNAAEFVKILTDAILDDEALEKDSPNPLYGLGKSTLEAYYSGRLPISQKKASALTPRLDEAKFADFVNTYSFDALNHMKDKLAEFGFDVEPSEVGQACANILAQIIRRRSEGLSDDVTALNYQRMETGRSLKNIAPATIERRGDKLHISGEVITIHQALVPDDVGKHELDYIRALYEAYAQKLNKETFTADDVPSLPKRYAENYKEQRMAYYSAVSIELSVRDIFDDGEDEFGRLKDDAWHGIKGTSHGKGYRSYLNTVLIMMLRKYLALNAKFDPHIFIIDTPLYGFDDGVDDRMPDSMRAGLYRYFMNHQDEGQLIIIENLDHIPSLEYEKHGAVVETFGKGLIPGTRYGFLNDVK